MAISTTQLNDMRNSLERKMTENLRDYSNQSLELCNSDLSVLRHRMISSLTNVLESYGFASSRNDVEYYVDSILINDIRRTHQNFVGENYQNFEKINAAILNSVESKNQAIDKTIEEKDAAVSNDIYNSNNQLQELQEIYANRVNYSEQFTDLFRSIISSSGIYSNPEAVEELKKVIITEKQNAEQMMKNNVSNLVDQNRISWLTNARSFHESLMQLELKSQEIVQNAVEQTRQKAEEDIIIEYVEVPQQPQLSPQTQELVMQAQDVLNQQQTNVEMQRTTQMLNNMNLEELEQYKKTGIIPQHLQDLNNPNLVSNVQPNVK